MLNFCIILDSVKDMKDIILILQVEEVGFFGSANIMMDRDGRVQPLIKNW